MPECDVRIGPITDPIICKNLNGLCAFLMNEHINNGDPQNLIVLFEKESDRFLTMLIENKAGRGYRDCARHEEIAKAAQLVLNARKKLK